MHFDHPSEHERPQGGSPFGFDYPPRPPYSNYPYAAPPRLPAKKKWLACLFSIMMPGTGQMYLGQMNRGLFIMFCLILDICAIVLSAVKLGNPALTTLFSLIVPIIYFYNVFETLQLADWVYYSRMFGGEEISDPTLHLTKISHLGVILIMVGVFFFLASSKPSWLNIFFDILGSYLGGGILIGAGIVLLLWENRKNKEA